MNARGVTMTMMQGHNWMPIPLTEYTVNVGTLPVVPARGRQPAATGAGKARCQLMRPAQGAEGP